MLICCSYAGRAGAKGHAHTLVTRADAGRFQELAQVHADTRACAARTRVAYAGCRSGPRYADTRAGSVPALHTAGAGAGAGGTRAAGGVYSVRVLRALRAC